jgi:hypothetical protein
MSDTLMAPGHPYVRELGTGLEITETTVRLWGASAPGVMDAEVPHTGLDQRAFFEKLRHGEFFPGVTHWWFGSPWTQTVAVERQPSRVAGTAQGSLRFAGEQEGLWWAEVDLGTERLRVHVDLPTGESLVNLPLVGQLTRLVVLALADEIDERAPVVISALVPTEHLESAFPVASLLTDAGRQWEIAQTDQPLRRWWLGRVGLS